MVVSKSQYAKLRGVSQSRVSQWINEGRIGPDALVGTGRYAAINVEVAELHLARTQGHSAPASASAVARLRIQAQLLQQAAAELLRVADELGGGGGGGRRAQIALDLDGRDA